MNDLIVKLLDGTEMLKSKVPLGEIFINEKGQKARKVIKPTAPTNPSPEAVQAKSTSTQDDDVHSFGANIISRLLKGVDLDAILAGLDAYEKQSGKSAKQLRDFINKLKGVK